jgi:ADP-ribose pyrophosphatase YjhB (NUDIX family)
VTGPLPEWAAALSLARPMMGAGVLFVDDVGRVLLVRPSYKAGWDIPGGVVEPGESPRTAAARELLEELGVGAPFGRLLTVDWAQDDVLGDKLLWVFEGEPIDEATAALLRVDGEELLEVGWRAPSEITELCPPPLARRLLNALREKAAGTGDRVYTEDGEPVPSWAARGEAAQRSQR